MINYMYGVDSIADPVSDYANRHKDDLKTGGQSDHIIKIEVGLSNNGRQDMFLSHENSGILSEEYENRVYTWDLYLKLADGKYALMDAENVQIDDNNMKVVKGQSIAFDPDKIYVGYISEIRAWGILATYYLPKHSEAAFSAFVLRSNYFEELNFPNPREPVGTYHRDDTNTIVDLPQAYVHYVTSPSTAKVVVLPQTY